MENKKTKLLTKKLSPTSKVAAHFGVVAIGAEGGKMKMKILLITNNGMFFSGTEKLVRNPEEAQCFTDINLLLDRLRDLLTLSLEEITQVRIISANFKTQ